ncbi:MAG: pseudouridine synthase [Pseudomonadota bacterium]
MLVLLNKPFRVLSQFTTDGDKDTLARFVTEKSVYPAGRLDYDSEGLLLLTSDGRLQSAIAEPRHHLVKTYWVQVEGAIDDSALQALRQGITLKDGPAKAIAARFIAEPSNIWPRLPPIRVRQTVPDSWIELCIDEGRNRQVRRMCAAIGHPCLRLIRAAVGPWHLGALKPGESVRLSGQNAWRQLKRHRATPP